MTLERRSLLGLGLVAGLLANQRPARAAESAGQVRIPLWPKGAPEPVPTGLVETVTERSTDPLIRDRAIKGVTAPWLEAVRPIQPNGASIIIMPGGGYRYMAWDKEGPDLANWFAARGIAGFSLGYRLPHDGWAGGPDTPLADAQRAVRLVRANAVQWGLDPNRIAVMGFSAGGHLCANLAAQFDRSAYVAQDAADQLSARPDLAAPIYPAVKIELLSGKGAPGEALFGRPLSAETMVRHSPHLNVPKNAPPHFLVHAEDDPLVSPDHSLALRSALVARGIAAETHLFAKGGHGFGLRNTRGLPLADWPERLLAFGRSTGWLTA